MDFCSMARPFEGLVSFVFVKLYACHFAVPWKGYASCSLIPIPVLKLVYEHNHC